MASFEDKKENYISEINKIAKESFNDEQKKLAIDILNNANETNIDAIYTFITQRVKLGFTFDAAPEVAHNCISLCERDAQKSFGSPMVSNNHKLIIGENYDVLKNLIATYTINGKGLIDVIYIDPPYNTEASKKEGNDQKEEVESAKFIYRDKFTRNGWLNMMRERLVMARKLLSDTGVIFISIDDNEQAYLKVLCDEIFGENNFISMLSVENNPKGRKNSKFISKSNEYCLIYAKNIYHQGTYFKETIPKDINDLSQDDDGNYIHNSGKRVLVGENYFNDNVTDYNSDKHYSVYYNDKTNNIYIEKENRINDCNDDLIKKGFKRYYSYNNNGFVLNTYTSEKILELFQKNSLCFKNSKIYEKNFNIKTRLKSLIVNKKYKAIINNKEIDYNIDVKTTSANTLLKTILGNNISFDNPKNIGLIKLL